MTHSVFCWKCFHSIWKLHCQAKEQRKRCETQGKSIKEIELCDCAISCDITRAYLGNSVLRQFFFTKVELSLQFFKRSMVTGQSLFLRCSDKGEKMPSVHTGTVRPCRGRRPCLFITGRKPWCAFRLRSPRANEKFGLVQAGASIAGILSAK